MLSTASSSSPAATRIASWCALAVVELLAIRLFPTLPDVWDVWPIVGIAHAIAKILFLSIVIFAVIGWPKRVEIRHHLFKESNDAHLLASAAVSATAVLLALLVRAELAEAASGGEILAYAYAAAIVVAAVSLILVAAPFSFWRAISRSCRIELILAVCFGVFGLIAGEMLRLEGGSILSESDWARLSDVTLQLSYWLLAQFDASAFMDPSTRVLGAGNFSVRIYAACSGYEGLLLISLFLTGYFLVFRRSLRFPNVFVLFPLAMGAIWLLNSLRIALLVLIGAHLSPDIALGGFHSQFGWISFLLVALVIMTFAQRIAFFGVTTAPASGSSGSQAVRRSATRNPALIYLAPFVALMAGQIMMHLAAPDAYLLYPVKVLAVGAVLYALRDIYMRFWSLPALGSALLGGIAGVIWIATDPGAGTQTPLGVSLSELTPVALIAWLAFRAIGTIIMVPIAEELAFRGYLYRALLSPRFEKVDFRAFGFVALIVSSALFGLMHDRWLAAALAGLLYALIMIRRGRIEDAIAAHMTTNAVIFLWAVAAGQWSLL